MAYDHGLAERIRERVAVLSPIPAIEKHMFGGLAWFIGGNMAVAVSKDDLVVRMSKDAAADALGRPFVEPFGPAGRQMKSWVRVTPPALEADRVFDDWLRIGLDFAAALPPK
ncbi:MAG: TfoX/Sxy family protein [bacterium]